MIYVVWGSTYYFIGEAMREMPICLLGAVRFSVAGGILLIAALWQGEKPFRRRLIGVSSLCGLLLLFTDMAIIMLAQRYITSSLEAVLAASTLVWITLMDFRMWRRNFTKPGVVIGIISGLSGVALLYWGELSIPGGQGSYGVLLFMVACLSWSLGTLISKYKASAYERLNAWSGTAWQMLTAGAAFWLCSSLSGEWSDLSQMHLSLHTWGALIYLIIFGSVLAYSSYVWLLKTRPATEVGTHAYANPLVAMLLGAFGGNEIIRLPQYIGLGVIFLSLFLINHQHE